jgi:D-tyrosyl-tRNA(Tyr) deacylase
MRVLIQRVKSSQVLVNGIVIGKISRGLNLLVGISITDMEAEVDWMVSKCLDLRLFPIQIVSHNSYRDSTASLYDSRF